ncbi:hypothetical protein RB195_006467 [Necator americanus]|uniref:Uncharacterized protein n=1 Tax=Necator americanus TaxID=51031 RepID=A0ABR1BSR3_NECAM
MLPCLLCGLPLAAAWLVAIQVVRKITETEMMVMTADEVGVKGEHCFREVAESVNYMAASVSVPCDDDIIYLDSDEALSPLAKQPASDRSKISRLLLQVIRLHLTEKCSSPGCSAVMDQAQKLGKKVEDMEALATKLRKMCSAQQSEITRLNEEAAKNKRKLSVMEDIVKRQGVLIRDLEAQLSVLLNPVARPSPSGHSNLSHPKPVSNSTLVTPSMNNARVEQAPVVQRRVRSDAHLSSVATATPSAPRGARFYVDRNCVKNTAEKNYTFGEVVNPVRDVQPKVVHSPASSKTLNVCNPRTGRIQLDVPFVAGKLLVDFISPIGTPVLDYPSECHHCKVAGPIKLKLEIKTEPSNFLLTKKVQGVVKYTAFNGCRPKNVKMFCYLESAIKVRRWTSSLVHTFADSDKIKFDIVFSKDQQVARFDRIVAFAFASTGTDKFVTNRVVFNIGLQMEAQNEQSKDQGSVCAQIVRPSALEPMETDSPAPMRTITDPLNDSNFEVYRP